VGVAALAAVLAEEVETVEDVYEPYLLRIGFLDRTPQGRVATDRARAHLAALGYDVPPRRTERDRSLWETTAAFVTGIVGPAAAPPTATGETIASGDPHALTVANVTRSLRDNAGFMPLATLDNLRVTVPPSADEVDAYCPRRRRMRP
jgi:hypothetical protein